MPTKSERKLSVMTNIIVVNYIWSRFFYGTIFLVEQANIWKIEYHERVVPYNFHYYYHTAKKCCVSFHNRYTNLKKDSVRKEKKRKKKLNFGKKFLSFIAYLAFIYRLFFWNIWRWKINKYDQYRIYLLMWNLLRDNYILFNFILLRIY